MNITNTNFHQNIFEINFNRNNATFNNKKISTATFLNNRMLPHEMRELEKYAKKLTISIANCGEAKTFKKFLDINQAKLKIDIPVPIKPFLQEIIELTKKCFDSCLNHPIYNIAYSIALAALFIWGAFNYENNNPVFTTQFIVSIGASIILVRSLLFFELNQKVDYSVIKYWDDFYSDLYDKDLNIDYKNITDSIIREDSLLASVDTRKIFANLHSVFKCTSCDVLTLALFSGVIEVWIDLNKPIIENNTLKLKKPVNKDLAYNIISKAVSFLSDFQFYETESCIKAKYSIYSLEELDTLPNGFYGIRSTIIHRQPLYSGVCRINHDNNNLPKYTYYMPIVESEYSTNDYLSFIELLKHTTSVTNSNEIQFYSL